MEKYKQQRNLYDLKSSFDSGSIGNHSLDETSQERTTPVRGKRTKARYASLDIEEGNRSIQAPLKYD